MHVWQEIKMRNFRYCNSDANEVSKSGGTLKVEYANCFFYNYYDSAYQKLSKLVHATRT